MLKNIAHLDRIRYVIVKGRQRTWRFVPDFWVFPARKQRLSKPFQRDYVEMGISKMNAKIHQHRELKIFLGEPSASSTRRRLYSQNNGNLRGREFLQSLRRRGSLAVLRKQISNELLCSEFVLEFHSAQGRQVFLDRIPHPPPGHVLVLLAIDV
jgi:hypothetical protein